MAFRLIGHPLGAHLERTKNNFDLVRLIAALGVIYGHSFSLVRQAEGVDITQTASRGLEYAGSFAVYAFFLLSGILITASYARQQSLPRFLSLRLARIWPALFVFCLVSAYIVGPLLSTLPPQEYFHSAHVSHFFWANISLLAGVWMYLPGVFAHNPAAGGYNWPIWTLALEVKCYLLVAAVGTAGIVARRWALAIVSIALIAALIVAGRTVKSYIPPENAFLDCLTIQAGFSFYPTAFFLAGMAIYALRDYVRFSGAIATVLCAGAFVLRNTVCWQPMLYVAFAAIVLWISTSSIFHCLRPKHDYSYGIYIYGFTVQQIVVQMFPEFNWWRNCLLSIPTTAFFAAISWHAIESPILRFAHQHLRKSPCFRIGQ